MKKFSFILIAICLYAISFAQNNVRFDNIVTVDAWPPAPGPAPKVLPADPDFRITNDEFVMGLMSKFTYWDEMFDNTYKNTLIIHFNKETYKTDSILVVENSLDK